MSSRRGPGRVVLVGAGPGDADLITLRGAAALAEADAVVYDSLVAPELLRRAPPGALRIDVGKRGHDPPTRSQEEINALLVRLAREGRVVVRLKGGDPFVFGRGGEEASACLAAGVPVEVVPGVSSALAAPAAAGIPVTDRRHAGSFAVVTGHRDATRPWTSLRWDRLARGADTLVILMGMRHLERIVATLLEYGRDPATPAAVVMEALTPRQRIVVAPLGELAKCARDEGLGSPAVVVVGDVVRLREELAGACAPRPLAGWRVLVTRPADASSELAAALRGAGAEARVLPTVRLEPCAPSPGTEPLRDLLEHDALVLTSATAARRFGELARREGVDPKRLRLPVLCVGAATARAAREQGFADPWVPEEAADAEALLAAMRARMPLAGRRVLFPCSEQARPTLRRGLEAAGASLTPLVLYRTAEGAADPDALRRALVQGELDALTFTSPSAVRGFVAGLNEPARAAARRCVVAAIGRVTAGALRDAGLPPAVCPERPGVAELVEALAVYASQRPEREER